jgi:SNF2 family DNA or RNA helicase
MIVMAHPVAGTGLTLIEANHVFHYGRWWNPATESQATDRVYRIGQTRDVHVYYLVGKAP